MKIKQTLTLFFILSINSFAASIVITVDNFDKESSDIDHANVPMFRKLVRLTSAKIELSDLNITDDSNKYTQPLFPLNTRTKIEFVREPVQKMLPGSPIKHVFKKSTRTRMDIYPPYKSRVSKIVRIKNVNYALVEVPKFQYNYKNNSVIPNTVRSVKLEHQRPTFTMEMSVNSPHQLIVIGKDFEYLDEFEKYLEIQKKLGIKTSLIYMKTLGSNIVANTVRNKIVDFRAQNPSLTHVLLLGDMSRIPTYYTDSLSPNDRFYASLDGNYEEDIYGVDVAVGRLPAKSSSEAKTMLWKYFDHLMHKLDPKSKTSDNHASFLATDDKWEIAEGTHNAVINKHTQKAGLMNHKIYAITEKANSDDFRKALLNKHSLITYSGHGFQEGWAGPEWSKEDIQEMPQHNVNPLVFSFACLTTFFSNPTSGFGETWIKEKTGALAYWGASDYSYWGEDDILEKALFDSFYKAPQRTLGEHNNQAMLDLFTHYGASEKTFYYFNLYQLLGDPTIKPDLVKN